MATSRRQSEAAVLGWAGILPVLQGLAAWPFSLAFCGGRDCPADLKPASDALGRHRLEAPKLGGAACPCLVSRIMLSAAHNLPEDPALKRLPCVS